MDHQVKAAPWSTILYAFVLLAAILPGLAHAEVREIQAKGDLEVKIIMGPDSAKLRGGALDDAVLEKSVNSILLRGKDGQTLGSCVQDPGKPSTFTDASGQARYRLVASENTYQLRHPDGGVAYRVKIKEDKFNIYDASDNRLLHGKEKPDGYGVKDQKGKQVLKLKGVTSLKEASYLAVPIEAEFRILAWAANNW